MRSVSIDKKTELAYKGMFLNPDGQLKPEAELVLEDLSKFAQWFSDDIPNEELPMARQVGRHDVCKRIAAMLRNSGEKSPTFRSGWALIRKIASRKV